MAQPDENGIVDTTDYDVFSTLTTVPSHQENGAVLYSSENDDDAKPTIINVMKMAKFPPMPKNLSL